MDVFSLTETKLLRRLSVGEIEKMHITHEYIVLQTSDMRTLIQYKSFFK